MRLPSELIEMEESDGERELEQHYLGTLAPAGLPLIEPRPPAQLIIIGY